MDRFIILYFIRKAHLFVFLFFLVFFFINNSIVRIVIMLVYFL